jgi:hypothetical protein
MAPKAKKGKKKETETVEPEHDASWDRVRITRYLSYASPRVLET